VIEAAPPAGEVGRLGRTEAMNRDDFDSFRTLLVAKRDELMARVRAARSSEHEGNEEDAPDLGDRALTTMSRDLSYQLSTGERQILKAIDEALKRIDDGRYGLCTNCGRKIQVPRLQAVPWARHCIDCQELQDRGDL
jgi:DnaK suppressor protein